MGYDFEVQENMAHLRISLIVRSKANFNSDHKSMNLLKSREYIGNRII